MQGDRKLRVGQAIQQEISDMLRKNLKDPRIGFVTVTRVIMSADLKHAKVYTSIMGEEADKKKTLQGLNRAKGFIRREIARRLNLRYTPDIIFFMDETMEKAAYMDRLFKKIEQEKEHEAPAEEDEPGIKHEPS